MARASRWALSRGKRLFDVVVAGLGLVMLGPVLLLVFALVRVSDGAPVLFLQERCGRDGRRFPLLKFRTMRSGSGSLVTSSGDARVTRLGARLRQFKLDELPQLINVLAGHMSLVGPRPEVPAYAAGRGSPWSSIRNLRPGITDWASLALSDEETVLRRADDADRFYVEHLVPLKVAVARLYRRRGGLGTDLAILALTGILPIVTGPLRARLRREGGLGGVRMRVERALRAPPQSGDAARPSCP
jgi:lipopolysaccharide/colanic/teichoic acid biosynthesis glycosyltransferase